VACRPGGAVVSPSAGVPPGGAGSERRGATRRRRAGRQARFEAVWKALTYRPVLAGAVAADVVLHSGLRRVSGRQHVRHERPIDSPPSETIQIGAMTRFGFKDPKSSHAIDLWPIWIAIPVVVVAGLASAIGAARLIWHGLGQPQLGAVGWDMQSQLETVWIALFVVGGIGGVVALVMVYRRQRVAEAADSRANSKLFNDRFIAACAELGNDAAAVRLAAVYTVARLADDWQRERQACIDVLCAYLRLPYQPHPDQPGWKDGEREVRFSATRIIRNHLRRTTDDPLTWRGYDLDLAGATFDGGDFTLAHFSGGTVTFNGATFSGGTVSFRGASFSGGTVTFDGATLSGGAGSFYGATFSGGTVSFDGATFSGGAVSFGEATFSGATVTFDLATFSGGGVSFALATFSGGTVSLDMATVSGGLVSFNQATFSGGRVSLDMATFSGGLVTFAQATVSDGTVTFHRATFSGGTVDLSAIYDVPPTFADCTISPNSPGPKLPNGPTTPTA
jgi:uncharacterized protein YjbI with pentapeptide repeats